MSESEWAVCANCGHFADMHHLANPPLTAEHLTEDRVYLCVVCMNDSAVCVFQPEGNGERT